MIALTYGTPMVGGRLTAGHCLYKCTVLTTWQVSATDNCQVYQLREIGVNRDHLTVFAEIVHRFSYAQEIDGFPAIPFLINDIILLTFACYTTS
jgi:hypothetical protein